MKRLLILFLIVFLFSSSSSKVFAEDASSSATLPEVNYDLPYPGLLPDNPLYYLKAIRDNVIKFFISDPLNKAEFNLLQADKRLGAASALFYKGQTALAITTLSKSGNYFNDAVISIYAAKKSGELVNPTLNNLLNSAIKHQQVIRLMEKNQKGDILLELKFYEDRAHDFGERVRIIESQ